MASVLTSVPGSGYGSVLVDALIWGGTAWDPGSGPITYAFGTQSDFAAANAVHQTNVVKLDGALLGWSAAEKRAFLYAVDLYASVSNLTFQQAAAVESADIGGRRRLAGISSASMTRRRQRALRSG